MITVQVHMLLCAQTIYYVGGFGGIHYIGDVPLELYQTAAASSPIRIPGRLAVQAAAADYFFV